MTKHQKHDDNDNTITGASFQCLKCDKVYEKSYDVPISFVTYQRYKYEGLFQCEECHTRCEPIAKFNGDDKDLEEPELEIKSKSEIKSSIPKVTEQDINFAIDTICKEAKHDKPAIKQLVYGLLSGMTNLGIHHKVNSKDSGEANHILPKRS